MTVLLTGVNWNGEKGMIGTALSKFLKKHKYNVVEFEGDIREESNYLKYNLIDMVIHLAAKPGVRESHIDPEYYYDINVNGTEQVFKFAQKRHIPILYASSSNVYEWWLNPYAVTKKITEKLADTMSLKAIGMRFHTVWPGRDDMLFQRIKKGEIEYINVAHSRDFIHIDDLCEAVFTIINNFDTIYQTHKVVDVGTGKDVPIMEVFMKYSKKKNVTLSRIPTQHERTRTKADVKYLKELGWEPKHNILKD